MVRRRLSSRTLILGGSRWLLMQVTSTGGKKSRSTHNLLAATIKFMMQQLKFAFHHLQRRRRHRRTGSSLGMSSPVNTFRSSSAPMLALVSAPPSRSQSTKSHTHQPLRLPAPLSRSPVKTLGKSAILILQSAKVAHSVVSPWSSSARELWPLAPRFSRTSVRGLTFTRAHTRR